MRTRPQKLMLTAALALAISGCAQLGNPSAERSTAIERALASDRGFDPAMQGRPTIDPALMALLEPPTSALTTLAPETNAPRFDVVVAGLPAREFFLGLGSGSQSNLVVHPEVNGTIDLNLRQVTLDEVLHAVERIYGYVIERKGNTYFVLPPRLEARAYPLRYLNVRRWGATNLRINSTSLPTVGSSSTASTAGSSAGTNPEENRSGSQLEGETVHDFWYEVSASLCSLIGLQPPQAVPFVGTSGSPTPASYACSDPTGATGAIPNPGDAASAANRPVALNTPRRSVVVSPLSGEALVRATAQDHEIIASFLKRAQSATEQQVVLEAKIIEVQLNDGFESGIDWMRVLTRHFGQTELTLAQSSIERTFTEGNRPLFSAVLSRADFSLFIDLLKTQGHVQVLSSPRIATLNNQKAVIKVGTDEYYVTNVTSGSQTTTTGTGTGTPTVTRPGVTLQPFFSGIALDVTPRIDADSIILHLKPLVSQVQEQKRDFVVFDERVQLPLARSEVRETDTVVRARDGQIIVIGGLMRDQGESASDGVPLLSDVPVFGELFKTRRNSSSKSELVILIRPTVIKSDETWDELRAETQQRLRMLAPIERGPSLGALR